MHEWISAYAGSEQVFEAIAQLYPDADLYALSANPNVKLDLGGRTPQTTFLNAAALRDRRSITLPMMPAAWRSLGRRKHDVAITSHHAFAHSHRLAEGGLHLGYVHSPARYLWSTEIDGRGKSPWLGPMRSVLQRVDLAASRRVDAYAANSTAVARRIQDFWDRDATVIHPPVDTEFFGGEQAPRECDEYVLGVGRWVPYKALHLVIEAADIAGIPVKIAGNGPEYPRLVAASQAANVPVEIVKAPTRETLRQMYQGAACLVFPTIEDFGLVPVEAQAAGTPVVGPAEGGLLDTVGHGESGILTATNEPGELAAAIRLAMDLDRAACRQNAAKFSIDAFRSAFSDWCLLNGAPQQRCN